MVIFTPKDDHVRCSTRIGLADIYCARLEEDCLRDEDKVKQEEDDAERLRDAPLAQVDRQDDKDDHAH